MWISTVLESEPSKTERAGLLQVTAHVTFTERLCHSANVFWEFSSCCNFGMLARLLQVTKKDSTHPFRVTVTEVYF